MSEQDRVDAAFDEVLTALNALAAAVSDMVHTNTTVTMFAAFDEVQERYALLQSAQHHYRQVMAGAS